MTDIYIRRSHNSRGCLRFVVAAAVVAVLVIGILVWRRGRAQAAPAPAEQVEEAPAAAAETAGEAATAQPALTADRGPALLIQARRSLEADDLEAARQACLLVLRDSRNAQARRSAEDILSDVHIRLVMSPRDMPEKIDYAIATGDTLAVLAKKFGTTFDLIRKSNNITGHIIRVGDRYRILQGTFSIRIDRSENELVLFLNDLFFKRYRVGTGKFEKTPIGTFEITDRIAQPTWWRPDGKAVPYGDPENVLGTHWLSLNIRGYGIHGTWEPDTIGKQESAGCIRLLNEDIEELYTLLPVGVAVTIAE